MFAYCNNNPIMYSDPTGCWPTWDDFVSGFQKACDWVDDNVIEPAIGFFEDIIDDFDGLPIGGAVTVANDFLDISLSNIFFGIETGLSDSYIMYGDFEQPVTFYAQNATDWWRLSEYRAGLSVNICGFGRGFSVSPLSMYTSFTAKNIHLELQNGFDKVGFTITGQYDYCNYAMGDYLHCYYRPWTVVPVVAAACYTYGVAGALLFVPSLCCSY